MPMFHDSDAPTFVIMLWLKTKKVLRRKSCRKHLKRYDKLHRIVKKALPGRKKNMEKAKPILFT
jgi:hypothetical protein